MSEAPGRLRDEFAALVGAGERADLARAALAIARIAHPGLDPAPSLRRLDALAAGAPAGADAGALAAHLFGAGGFRGSETDYYDPRNSCLNDVLERRMGIPITLSVVFMEVAARCGLRVEGVGFPGHFLVRATGGPLPLLLDPFFGGRPVDEAQLLARYRALQGVDVPALPPDALAATGTTGILARMLRNLLRIYLQRGDHPRALDAADLVLVLVPDSADELRVRGLLYAQLDCFGAAAADLRRYAELVPDAPDAARIRERADRLARAASTVH